MHLIINNVIKIYNVCLGLKFATCGSGATFHSLVSIQRLFEQNEHKTEFFGFIYHQEKWAGFSCFSVINFTNMWMILLLQGKGVKVQLHIQQTGLIFILFVFYCLEVRYPMHFSTNKKGTLTRLHSLLFKFLSKWAKFIFFLLCIHLVFCLKLWAKKM